MNTSAISHRLPIVTLVVATMLVAACTSAASSPAPIARVTPSLAVETTPKPPPAAIVGEFDAGGAGWAMTKAGGALWIQVDPPVDSIVRIDVATGTAAPAVAGGWQAKSGEEGLWVVCCDWLARVDPATGQELLRVPMGGRHALADGEVWLASDDHVYRIDANTGAVGDPIGPNVLSLCEAPKDLVVTFGSAWLACKEGTVVRIEISSGDATTIPTAAGSHTFAVLDEAVWVTNYQAGSVSRIDPTTNQVTTIEGAGSGVGITTGDGYVWAATSNGIAKIDPATNSILREIDLGPGQYYELVWDEGIIWVSTRGSRVLKVDPSKATR